MLGKDRASEGFRVKVSTLFRARFEEFSVSEDDFKNEENEGNEDDRFGAGSDLADEAKDLPEPVDEVEDDRPRG